MTPRRALAITVAATTLVCLGTASRGAVCPPAPDEPSPVVVEAGSIQSRGPLVSAAGGVSLLSRKYRIRASELLFDTRSMNGKMSDVVFTTCDKAQPDYRFVARELSLLPHNRIHARGASVFLGKFKVFTLPSVKLAIGRKGVSTDTFPRPGFDKDDGFGISQKLGLIDTERLQVNADVRVTAKRGLEGEVDNTWGIDGDLIGLPGRFLTYESLRSSVLTMPRYFGSETEQTPQTSLLGVARLRQYGRFSLKQRTYDIRNTGLLVYRQPEIGLTYTARSLNLTRKCLDPRLEMYPTINVSWGQFRETPGSTALTNRAAVGVVAGGSLFSLGPRSAIQPLIAYSAAAYQGGMSYRTSAYAIDASHIFSDGSIASLRYIKRNEWGTSPFLFDTINMTSEFQGAFQLRLRSQIIGFVAGFDADTGKTYDWELLYGYHTDCLAAWITWDNLLKRFMFDAALINL